MKEIKIVFMGTPEFSVPVLEALINEYKIVGVVTQPDRGPKEKAVFSPIKKVALKNNLPLFQPDDISKNIKEITQLHADIIITCAYGQIIPRELLTGPRLGCVNVHASLLPKLRGGAPIHRAIIEGYKKTGITIMYMVEKLDAGDIISQVETEITDNDDAGSLHNRLSLLGRDLLISTLPDIISGNVSPVKQNKEEVTFGWNIKREDEKVDFEKSKREVFNKIRGLSPWPGAYSILDEKIVKIWHARIGENGFSDRFNGEITKIYEDGIGVKVNNGEIILTEIQLEGKTKMQVRDYLNGLKDKQSLVGRSFQ